MGIEDDSSSGSIGSTEGAQTTDSGAGAAADPAVSSEQTVSTGEAPAATTGSAATAAESLSKGPTGSLTSPTDAAQSTPSDEAYQKRWKDTRAWGQQNQNRALQLERDLQALKQQFDGVDANQVKAWRDAQKSAEAQKLPVWNPRNPTNASFKGAYERYRFAKESLGRVPPEARDSVQQALFGGFSTDDLKSIREFEAAREESSRRIAEDPDTFIEERFQRFFENAIQNWHQSVSQNFEFAQKVQGGVQAWFSDPANKPIVETHGDDMARRLKGGEPWEIVRRDAEIAQLKGRVGEAAKTKQAADEQQRLLKGSAANTITRDGAARPVTDLAAMAKKIGTERGYSPGDPRYLKLIDELRLQHA